MKIHHLHIILRWEPNSMNLRENAELTTACTNPASTIQS